MNGYSLKSLVNWPVLNFLQWATSVYLKRAKITIVGVTGSVGKSSFVYLLDSVAKSDFKVKTTFHGNSETGLPLEILRLREQLTDSSPLTWLKVLLQVIPASLRKPEFNLLIAEMGIDSPFEPKNMSYLLKIIRPDIGVFLNIAPVHTEQFSVLLKGSVADKERILQLITAEKGKLVTTLGKDKTAVINADSIYIKRLMPKIHAEVTTFGEKPGSSFRLVHSDFNLAKGSSFTVDHNKQKLNLTVPGIILSPEYGMTIAAVLATAQSLGIQPEVAVKRLQANFRLPPGRLSLITGKKSSMIIDSSYNSSPLALQSTLRLLGSLKTKGKKIAVLGDMRELGNISETEHKDIAGFIRQNSDFVVLVGPLMKEYTLPELQRQKYPKDKIAAFKTSQGVGEYVQKHILTNNNIILIKGSQNTIFLEEVVKDLMADPEKAHMLLCRQNDFWAKTRNAFFQKNPNEKYL